MQTYAINITEQTYDLVSAFLPPGFLFIPRGEIENKTVAVINDFSVVEDAEDGGEVTALSNSWYSFDDFNRDFIGKCRGDQIGPFHEVRRR